MSMSVKRFMLDVYRGDVVEVLDVRLRPSHRRLRRSVCFVSRPSAQKRGMVAAFSCSFLQQPLWHGLSAIGYVRAFFTRDRVTAVR